MPSTTLDTVLVLAQFSGTPGAEKLRYLEKLDAALTPLGKQLLLINQNGEEIQSSCKSLQVSREITQGKQALTDSQQEKLNASPELQHAVSIDAGHLDSTTEIAARNVIPLADTICEILKSENVTLAILWHQFNGVVMAVSAYCTLLNIPVLYAHLGPLPGTIIFEAGGQMAESRVCRENDHFNNLPVSDNEISITREYLDTMRLSKADRKVQPENYSIAASIEKFHSQNKPILFYAGQNDYRSGMIPRTLPHAELHSPFFNDTLHALEHLSAIAEKKNWGILFKSHPNCHTTRNIPEYKAVENISGTNVFDVIVQSDVTVTILSTTAYLSLIQDKPVVLLGNMLLSGKNCAYEISSVNDISERIQEALNNRFSQEQRQHFHRHCAQLLKYYLFTFYPDTEKEIGQSVEQAATFIAEHS